MSTYSESEDRILNSDRGYLEDHTLQKLRFAISREIDRAGLDLQEPRLDFFERTARHIILELQGYVWAENITEPIEFKVPKITHYDKFCPELYPGVPSSKWQMLKHMFFPAWILKRFPVKYTEDPFIKRAIVSTPIPMKTERIDVRVVYPKLKIAYPHETHVVRTFRGD